MPAANAGFSARVATFYYARAMAALDGHRTAELRSLAYHRRIAEKLRTDPTLVHRAREKLEAILKELGPDSKRAHYARGWYRLISGPLDDLATFLQSDDPVSREFRQASPFAGALGARERWQIWREVADGEDR